MPKDTLRRTTCFYPAPKPKCSIPSSYYRALKCAQPYTNRNRSLNPLALSTCPILSGTSTATASSSTPFPGTCTVPYASTLTPQELAGSSVSSAISAFAEAVTKSLPAAPATRFLRIVKVPLRKPAKLNKQVNKVEKSVLHACNGCSTRIKYFYEKEIVNPLEAFFCDGCSTWACGAPRKGGYSCESSLCIHCMRTMCYKHFDPQARSMCFDCIGDIMKFVEGEDNLLNS